MTDLSHSQLLHNIFSHVSDAVDANYRAAPLNAGDKSARGKYTLQAVTADKDAQYDGIVLKTNDGIVFGLKVQEPSFLRRLFGVKADVVVAGDSVNILTMGTDFSNTRRYGLRGDQPQDVANLGQKIAGGLEIQYRVRRFLGI